MQKYTQKLEKHRFVEDSRNSPEKKFASGSISATVWLNQTTSKNEVVNFRTVSFQRRYKDKSGQWQNSTSLRVNDLPRASLVLQKAYEYLVMKDTSSLSDSYRPEEIVEEII